MSFGHTLFFILLLYLGKNIGGTGMIRGLLSILFLFCLVIQTSSQGYVGTVNTGTGIEAPITVGYGAAPQGASVGASAAANLTGTMSLNLIDGITRQINLDIIQSGDLLLGYGNMTSGTGIQRVTAGGALMANGITLYILPADVPEVYRLNIVGSGTSLSGRYQAIAANGASWAGTVTGVSDRILDSRTATALGSGASAGLLGTVAGQPVGAIAQPIGQGIGSVSQPVIPNNIGRSRSFSTSSNGQTTTTT
jgi:hypothetical protein